MTADDQKVALIFGDSLTWGTDPATGGRHLFGNRWTTLVSGGLAGRFRIIVEGLRGRTTIFDDPSSALDRNGARALPILLASHYPIDVVMIMLGSNDLKAHVCGNAAGSAEGLDQLVQLIQNFKFDSEAKRPKIVLVAPPTFRRCSDGSPPPGNRSIVECGLLAAAYQAVSARRGCFFLDSSQFCETSPLDGVHLDRAGNANIAAAVLGFLSEHFLDVACCAVGPTNQGSPA